MTLFSATEDFWRNTLDAVPNIWDKLTYVSSLRLDDGRYEHWGLTRKYGEKAAQETIMESHRELTLQVLRTPIRQLMQAAANSAADSQTSLRAFVDGLLQTGIRLIPSDLGRGSELHFKSVLESISSLASTYTDANRQAS